MSIKSGSIETGSDSSPIVSLRFSSSGVLELARIVTIQEPNHDSIGYSTRQELRWSPVERASASPLGLESGDVTTRSHCSGCGKGSTWAGPVTGKKLVWCARCQRSTEHVFDEPRTTQ